MKTAKDNAAAANAAKAAEDRAAAELGLGVPLSDATGDACAKWIETFIKEHIEERPNGDCCFRAGKQLPMEQIKALINKVQNWKTDKGASY